MNRVRQQIETSNSHFAPFRQIRQLASSSTGQRASSSLKPQESDTDGHGAEERFRIFVESVSDYAIVMLDAQGTVISWNPGAERIKGYSASEIIGKHFSCFYRQEDVGRGWPQTLLALAAEGGRVEDEGWRVRKNGSKFWAYVVITAMKDDQGKLLGFGKVTRDLTERMLTQERLKKSQSRAEESEKSLRELSLHVLRTQDEERKNIGREMHDSLGQSLSIIKMKLDFMRPESRELAECSNLLDDCLREVRTISYLLYPPMLEEIGLKAAIPWYLEGFSKRSGITTTFSIQDDLARLSPLAELALFRVLQEALTNVKRHSGSAGADIRIFKTEGSVVMEIADHGKGLPADLRDSPVIDANVLHGVGLRGMSERLRQLGGTFTIFSGDSGTTIRATLPLSTNLPHPQSA